MSQCQKMKKLHWLHQLMTCHYHSPPYSIVTVRVLTSKLTKRSPRGISSSPIETPSPRCHRPSMTACKITRALVIITYWNVLTTKRVQTISNPPKTDPKCWNWCSLKKNWGIQRVPKDWTSTKQIAIKGTCKLNTVQYLNSHFFKIDIKTSSTTSCILLIIKLFIFN